MDEYCFSFSVKKRVFNQNIYVDIMDIFVLTPKAYFHPVRGKKEENCYAHKSQKII